MFVCHPLTTPYIYYLHLPKVGNFLRLFSTCLSQNFLFEVFRVVFAFPFLPSTPFSPALDGENMSNINQSYFVSIHEYITIQFYTYTYAPSSYFCRKIIFEYSFQRACLKKKWINATWHRSGKYARITKTFIHKVARNIKKLAASYQLLIELLFVKISILLLIQCINLYPVGIQIILLYKITMFHIENLI